MPWTVAVVDLRAVLPPDPARRPRLFLQPPSCQQADGARRSVVTPRAPPERHVVAGCSYARIHRMAPIRALRARDAFLRAHQTGVQQRMNAYVRSKRNKEPTCPTVTVIPYATQVFL